MVGSARALAVVLGLSMLILGGLPVASAAPGADGVTSEAEGCDDPCDGERPARGCSLQCDDCSCCPGIPLGVSSERCAVAASAGPALRPPDHASGLVTAQTERVFRPPRDSRR